MDRSRVWYLAPGYLAVLPFVGALVIWWAVPSEVMRVTIPGGKAPIDRGVLFLAGGAAALAVAAAVGRASARTRPVLDVEADAELLSRIGQALAAVAATTQACWTMLGTIRAGGPGVVVNDFLSGRPTDVIKFDYFTPVAGLTTLTQLAPVAALTCAVVLLTLPPDRHEVRRRCWIGLALAFFPGMIRGPLLSERLALYETVLPMLLAFLLLGGRFLRRQGRSIAVAIAGVAFGFVVVFVGAESTRSYVWDGRPGSPTTYGLWRLSQYAFTSINNGARIVTGPPELRAPARESLHFLWDFPVLSALWPYDELVAGARPAAQWLDGLYAQGAMNRAFNTYTGPGYLYLDYGVMALLACAAIGFAGGRLFAHFQHGSLVGLLVYPLLAAPFLDFWRTLQFGSGRSFPALTAALGISWIVPRLRVRRDPSTAVRAEGRPALQAGMSR